MRPLTIPRTSPSPIPNSHRHGRRHRWSASMSATTKATRPIIASTDRSTLRVMTTIASPTAAIAMIEASTVTLVRFDSGQELRRPDGHEGAHQEQDDERGSARAGGRPRRQRARRRAAPGSATSVTAASDMRLRTPGQRRVALAGRREHHRLLGRVRAGDLRRDRPSCRTRIRSDIARTSGRSLEIRMIAKPGRRQLGDDAGGPRPWRRCRCRGSARRGSAPAARRPATCRARPSAGCRRTGHAASWSTPVAPGCCSCVDVALADRALVAAAEEQAREEPRQDRQRHVGCDREVEDEPVLVAVLGHVGDARPPAPPTGCANETGSPPRRMSPASATVDPEQDAGDLGPSGADQPGQTEDLAGPHRRSETSRNASPRDRPVDLEEDVADRRLDLREQRDGAADHVADEVGRGQLGASGAVTTCLPSRRTVARSHSSNTSSRRWLTNRTATPRSRV